MPSDLVAASDEQLVGASRRGDRAAFEQIVRRYQAMISGLIYAGCGDLHQSEDLAQETFVVAWQKLAALREPGRLAAWLGQIARHRLADALRRRRGAMVPLSGHDRADRAAQDAGRADALNQEQRERLWRALSQLACPYRRTLVLYYRQGKSVAAVAAAMDTSQANVRQRLARGREMLREQIVGQVEQDLERSRPGVDFSLAVMAGLPLAAQEGALAIAGKSASAAKGAGLLGPMLMGLPGLIAIGVGISASREQIRQAQLPVERRLVVKWTAFIWLVMAGFVAVQCGFDAIARRMGWGPLLAAWIRVSLWLVLVILAAPPTVWASRRRAVLRRQAGLPAATPQWIPRRFERLEPLLAGLTLASIVGCFVYFPLNADDWIGAALLVALGLALTISAPLLLRGRSWDGRLRVMLAETGIAVCGIMVLFNWRLYWWLGALDRDPARLARLHEPRGPPAPQRLWVCAGDLHYGS